MDVSASLTSRPRVRTLPPKHKWDGTLAFQQSDLVYAKKIPGKGRGVFASKRISKGTIIERVPVVILPVQEIYTDKISTTLADYVFNWGDGEVVIALGYGSLYNHSYDPNAAYAAKGRQSQVYSALRDIEADEEITVNYNGSPKDQAKLWFDAVP